MHLVHAKTRNLEISGRATQAATPDATLRTRLGTQLAEWLSSNAMPRDQRSDTHALKDVSLERDRAKQSLRVSEQRFRLLLESVRDYAIFMLDADGHVMTWNPGAERMTGYSEQEILGRHFSCFYPDEAADRDWPEEELRRALRDGRFEDEGWRVRSDGSQYWSNVVITPMYEDGRLQGFAKVTRDLTERRRIEQKVEAARDELEQRVQDRTQDLARANAALARENAERRQLEADLKQLVRELTERDRQKNVFLATLAHELRNPLAPIRSAHQVLERLVGRSGDARHALEVIDRQLLQLTRLISDLLDLSRITSGKLELQREPATVESVLQAALETKQPLIAAESLHVELSLPGEQLWVHGDPLRLAQVFANLLDNAVKFTPPGGDLQIEAQRDADTVEIRVVDSGVGIAPTLLPEVFDMFRQGGGAGGAPKAGLGIGLTLSKQIVELHAGTIRAESGGEGQGSTFSVTLPLREAPRHSSSPSHPDRISLSGHRVLVVDDNPDSVEMLRALLSMMGAEVETAIDGRSAIELAERFRPTTVLLDIGMPELDGYETARHMRQTSWGRTVELVAVTGWGQSEDRDRTAEAGFDRHLVKPVEMSELFSLFEPASRRGSGAS